MKQITGTLAKNPEGKEENLLVELWAKIWVQLIKTKRECRESSITSRTQKREQLIALHQMG